MSWGWRGFDGELRFFFFEVFGKVGRGVPRMAEFPVVIVVADDKKGLPPFFLSLHRDGLDQIVKTHCRRLARWPPRYFLCGRPVRCNLRFYSWAFVSFLMLLMVL